MYRETLLGTALGATLSELSETHNLSEAQREHLWAIFDDVMQSCLEEIPMTTDIQVRVPLPRLPPTQTVSTSAPRRAFTEEGEDNIPSLVESTGEAPHSDLASSEDNIPFPVYRFVDGVWTILLKNPTVRIRDEYQSQEELELDYLKVVLRQVGPGGNGAKTRSRHNKSRKS